MSDRTPADVLEELRHLRATGALASLCEDRGIRMLVAFGSILQHPSAARDLDLAVVLDDPVDFIATVGEMIGWLRSDAIDVLDLRRADAVARYEALARGELLHEAEPGAFHELQISAVAHFADTQWLRDLQLEALSR
jgi:hypothetical protein